MPRCLPANDAVLIHGANGVCGPPQPSGATAIASTLAALLALALLWRRARRRFVVVLAVACALPGWWALACARADRPGHAAEVAAAPRALADTIERFAAAHRDCVTVADRCLACEPVVHFAVPEAARCAAPATIALGADALTRGCRAQGRALVCGGGGP